MHLETDYSISRLDIAYTKLLHDFYELYEEKRITEDGMHESLMEAMNAYFTACKEIAAIAKSTTRAIEAINNRYKIESKIEIIDNKVSV